MIDLCLEKLRADPIEGLRWYVARALGIAPYGQTDEQVVKCGLHLLMERQGIEYGGSAAFDEGHFLALKERAGHET